MNAQKLIKLLLPAVCTITLGVLTYAFAMDTPPDTSPDAQSDETPVVATQQLTAFIAPITMPPFPEPEPPADYTPATVAIAVETISYINVIEAEEAEEAEEEAKLLKKGKISLVSSALPSDLAYTEALTVSASAYTTERQSHKTTATGTTARVGAIAVDPRVIPYGTKMYIVSAHTDDNGNPSWVYGYATAEDCGGGIKGNKIDVFFDTYDECIQFGRKDALVYIIDDEQ